MNYIKIQIVGESSTRPRNCRLGSRRPCDSGRVGRREPRRTDHGRRRLKRNSGCRRRRRYIGEEHICCRGSCRKGGRMYGIMPLTVVVGRVGDCQGFVLGWDRPHDFFLFKERNVCAGDMTSLYRMTILSLCTLLPDLSRVTANLYNGSGKCT